MSDDDVPIEDDSASQEMRGARPARNTLRMDAVRARAEGALFGKSAPARVGRYVLVGPESQGGMGVVYAAYDPELDRKVALKVLHPRHRLDARARQRLQTEARALAKLDDTNVVKVHDVLLHDGQVVLVMEWVDGTTIQEWERSRTRDWKGVLDVFVQAGRGLAAAHRVGVIHRDFKPSNAVIGADGRVRVLDFGLASLVADGAAAPASGPAAGDSAGAELTATGDVVGTLAYSSPEQLAAGVATEASDQFSFGVALHRALEGIAPFAGSTAAELEASIRAGAIAHRRKLPAWLRATVARMLAALPAERFPSMDAALAELTRRRGWSRWRTPAVIGVASMLPVTVAVALRTPDETTSCDGGRDELANVWTPDARASITTALTAIASPYAADVRARVVEGLDAYAVQWSATHRNACLAHQRGEQSEALLDRRMLCMHRRLGDLRSAIGVLTSTPTALDRALDVVARLPPLADCSDLERLQLDHPPPRDPATRASIAEIESWLSEAGALERIGRFAEALALADRAIALAREQALSAALAEATLARGRILLTLRDYKLAVTAFRDARSLALEARMFAVAVEAAAREIYVEGTTPSVGNRESLEREVSVFLPLSKTLDGDHFARPLLLNNIGTVRMAAGDRTEATRYFQEARRALDGVPDPDLELTCIDKNLAMVTADAPSREALARGVWDRLRGALGDYHVSTIDALDGYARYVADAKTATTFLRRECDALDRMHPELVSERVYCASYLAFLVGLQGDAGQELRLLDGIVATSAVSDDSDVVARARLAGGLAAIERGRPEESIKPLSEIVAADASSPEWWVTVRAAHAQVALARARKAMGDACGAARLLRDAIAAYRRVALLNEEMEFRFRLEQAVGLLAALEAGHREEIRERRCGGAD